MAKKERPAAGRRGDAGVDDHSDNDYSDDEERRLRESWEALGHIAFEELLVTPVADLQHSGASERGLRVLQDWLGGDPRELGALHAIERGRSIGGKRGRDTKRDEAAHKRDALLDDVATYRRKHPRRGRETIAKALLAKHGRPINQADPDDERRAVRALAKRIERAEKSRDMY